ncbi:MAG: AsmA family protein [Hyphomicrobiales bacterium]
MRGRSPWRSPLLILGIAVILLAATAGAAPFFIRWENYRSDLETWGKRITGREVRIDGPIDAALFPWPRLTLHQVTVANAQGATEPFLLSAPVIDIALALPPLLSGKLEMTEVKVSQPAIALEETRAGADGWRLAPDPTLLSSIEPDQVSFPSISVDGGSIALIDGRHDLRLDLDLVDASASSPALSGPWKSTLRIRTGDEIRVIGLGTGQYRAGQPLRTYVSFGPEAGKAGYAVALDAAVPFDGSPAKGVLKVTPVAAADGRDDAQFGLQKMALRADVEATRARIALPKIEISPAAAGDAANMIAGSAAIDLGARLGVTAQLGAPRIDLDRLIGQQQRQELLSAGVLGAAAELAAHVPKNVDADLRVDVSSLATQGETLDGAVLEVSADETGVTIREFRASMPGQTTASFSGRLEGAAPHASFAGRIDLQSRTLRDFLTWLSPDLASLAEGAWTGSRGDLALSGAVEVESGRIALHDADVTLDDTKGRLGLDYKDGKRPSIDVVLTADAFDPSRYVPTATLPSLERLKAVAAAADVSLSAQFDSLALNGVTAKSVAIDVASRIDGFDVKRFDLGDVGGGRMSATGLVALPADGIEGTLAADLNADDPKLLARFLGAPSEIAETLTGPLIASLKAEAHQAAGKTVAAVTGNGAVGPARGRLDARFNGITTAWRDAEVAVTLDAQSASSAALAGLGGIKPAAGGDQPATVKLTASGTPAKGIATTLDVEGFAAATQFQGTVKADPAWQAVGRLAILAPDATGLLQSLGLSTDAAAGPAGKLLSAEGNLTASAEKLALSGLSGNIAGSTVTGDVALGLGDRPTVSAKLKAGAVDATALVGTLLMRGDGAMTLDRPFSGPPAGGATVDATVTATDMTLVPGIGLGNATMTARGDNGALALDVTGTGETGAPARVRLDARPAGQGWAVGVDGELALDLSRHLTAGSGSPALSGTATIAMKGEGEGLSPASVLAALKGSGSFGLSGARLAGVDPSGFAGGLETAKAAPDVDVLIDTTLRAGSIAVGDASVPLSVDAGIAGTGPIAVAPDGIDGTMKLLFDLTSGKLDLSADLDLKNAGRTLPTFELAWSGFPGALEATYDVAALKSAITVDVLKKGVDQLEALQKEQQRIVEEERAFARQQAIAVTEEAVRRYARARAAEDQARRDAVETARQSEATAMRKASEDATRAELTRLRAAEEAARQQKLQDELQQQQQQQQQQSPSPPGDAVDQQPLPFQAAPEPPPQPKPKPAVPPAAGQPAAGQSAPDTVGIPAVVPPVPGEGAVNVYVAPIPAPATPASPPPPPKPKALDTGRK